MTDPRRGDERVGDPAVDAAWHRASDEEPPTRVDDAILAAARAEARAVAPTRITPRSPPWWIRWQPLAAAAGVVGLAFVLVQLIPREEATRAPAVVRTPQAPAADAIEVPAEAPASAELQETAAAKAAPEAWARRVAELHAHGDLAAAAVELRAFRQAFPDADDYLPRSLLRWAATVPRADLP